MKKIILLAFSLLAVSPLFLQAAELDGYQKLRGQIISSNAENTSFMTGHYAFDTNKETSFRSEKEGGWIGLDLQNAYSIQKIRIYPHGDRVERMVGCVFQGANNPEFKNPETLFTITTAPSVNHYTIYDISSANTYRYVRCIAKEDEYCHITELEFYCHADEQNIEYTMLTNLPTIYLETGGSFNFNSRSHYEKAKITVLSDKDTTTNDVNIKGRDDLNWNLDKKSIDLRFDKAQQFMGLAADTTDWALIASHADKTLLRNGLAFRMSRFFKFEFTPSCLFADVVLDGFYYGTFFVSDPIEVGKNRIDIDEMTHSDNSAPEISGGYHLKIDTDADHATVHFSTPKGVDIAVLSPQHSEITKTQLAWIESHINKLEAALYEDPETACEKYIDINNAVAYYLLSELTANHKAYSDLHCYKKRGDDKLYFGPIENYDQAFLNDGYVDATGSILERNQGFKQWFPIIMQTKAAKEALETQWKRVDYNHLRYELKKYIEDTSADLEESQTLNYKRWDSLDKYVLTHSGELFDTYADYIEQLVDAVDTRYDWLKEHVALLLADKRQFLLTSKPENEKVNWRYTTTAPTDANWFASSYNDNQWKEGKAPFGTETGYSTQWNTEEIYLRKTFTVSSTVKDVIQKLYLNLFYDDNCSVYINGILAKKCTEAVKGYHTFEIEKSLLKANTNTIAIKCTRTQGGQMIDAGVFATVIPNTVENEHILPENKTYTYSLLENILTIDNISSPAIVSVYTIEGKLVAQQKANAQTARFTLPARGTYLIHIGNETLKIAY
ncbi:hypothetical protein D0T51_09240 [Parabacteroides sp. 52]|uniref:CotH kinase family protein n=1 Tax=unclassified Parabacteroides TaxID=2649774 RepID=UPI0013D467A6|nr:MULTISPECIES: CotH kinase family protein [unclassified Parabacteroides]MDH6535512.1 hypothetical protein [Parabacteroides sp. PM5-20]NDV55908.1 hypothetical protein [Parabacteroides sp. 52]